MNEDVSEAKGAILDVRRANYGKRGEAILRLYPRLHLLSSERVSTCTDSFFCFIRALVMKDCCRVAVKLSQRTVVFAGSMLPELSLFNISVYLLIFQNFRRGRRKIYLFNRLQECRMYL